MAITAHLVKLNPEKPVILVTKDINLRMKAKSLRIIAQDYLNDKVEDIDSLKKEIEVIEKVNDSLIQKLYTTEETLTAKELKLKPYANQYFIIKGNKSSALVPLDKAPKIGRVDKVGFALNPEMLSKLLLGCAAPA